MKIYKKMCEVISTFEPNAGDVQQKKLVKFLLVTKISRFSGDPMKVLGF